MGTLRIGPYVAFVSKFWAVEDVITRDRTASDLGVATSLTATPAPWHPATG